jgi:hypothetical protein
MRPPRQIIHEKARNYCWEFMFQSGHTGLLVSEGT